MSQFSVSNNILTSSVLNNPNVSLGVGSSQTGKKPNSINIGYLTEENNLIWIHFTYNHIKLYIKFNSSNRLFPNSRRCCIPLFGLVYQLNSFLYLYQRICEYNVVNVVLS